MARAKGFAVAAIALALVSGQPSGGADEPRCLGGPAEWDGEAAASSRACLACHDGSVAPAASLGATGAASAFEQHPIGVSYSEALLRNRTRLRPLGAIDPAITLPRGRIECVTCHDATSREPAMVVRSMAGSALCFACHDL